MKQNFGIELSSDISDNFVAHNKPSGKGSFARRGNTKFNSDCYGMDIAPIHEHLWESGDTSGHS